MQDAVLHDVATAAGEVGFDMNDPVLGDVADRAREVGLGNESRPRAFPAWRFEAVAERSLTIPLVLAGRSCWRSSSA